ncbi:3-methylaspartate ammonia-lyase glutamate mutase [Klebsiella michiganensis]|uniref:3-methylaspartate ammonia-lyase glutamate mutase n=1 Tax=Klebsiella michiganensis TaxID=1134687 RepID=A0A7H4N3Z2_9ENTR|nr:3-methylaspartate ammonia-lyase glutamate mutase [Klebsiella michiganensis]
MARTFKILSPTAILGYGFPEESFRKAMEASPDLIAVDAGSSDPGPHYLGAGKPFYRPGRGETRSALYDRRRGEE